MQFFRAWDTLILNKIKAEHVFFSWRYVRTTLRSMYLIQNIEHIFDAPLVLRPCFVSTESLKLRCFIYRADKRILYDVWKARSQFWSTLLANDDAQLYGICALVSICILLGWPSPPPPMLSSAPAMVLSAPAIIEGCQSMKWSGSIRCINNPVQSLELTDFTGLVT